MEAFGFSPAAIAAAVAQHQAMVRSDSGLAIHPDNARAVRLFLAMQTQWRTLSLSTMTTARLVRTGLDYGVVTDTARLEGLALELPDDFRRLRILEAEAIGAWAEEAR